MKGALCCRARLCGLCAQRGREPTAAPAGRARFFCVSRRGRATLARPYGSRPARAVPCLVHQVRSRSLCELRTREERRASRRLPEAERCPQPRATPAPRGHLGAAWRGPSPLVGTAGRRGRRHPVVPRGGGREGGLRHGGGAGAAGTGCGPRQRSAAAAQVRRDGDGAEGRAGPGRAAAPFGADCWCCAQGLRHWTRGGGGLLSGHELGRAPEAAPQRLFPLPEGQPAGVPPAEPR